MINLFAEYQDGKKPMDEFIDRKLSAETEKKYDEVHLEAEQYSKKAQPTWLATIGTIVLPIGLLLVIGMFLAKDGFYNALKTRGYIFYIGLALTLFGIGTKVHKFLRTKKLEKDHGVEALSKKADDVLSECYRELNIPEEHEKIDVLFAHYKKNKKGEDRIKSIFLFTHVNMETLWFLEDKHLCIADPTLVLKIPLNAFKRIVRINKKAMVLYWNKDKNINAPEYKEYKLKTNTYGVVFVKPYYSVELCINDKDYHFYIPNYDLKNVLKLLDLEVIEPEKGK